jgi:hypothetical protein
MCPVAPSITKQTVCLFLLRTAFKKGPKHVNSIPLRINSKFEKKIRDYYSCGKDDITHQPPDRERTIQKPLSG